MPALGGQLLALALERLAANLQFVAQLLQPLMPLAELLLPPLQLLRLRIRLQVAPVIALCSGLAGDLLLTGKAFNVFQRGGGGNRAASGQLKLPLKLGNLLPGVLQLLAEPVGLDLRQGERLFPARARRLQPLLKFEQLLLAFGKGLLSPGELLQLLVELLPLPVELALVQQLRISVFGLGIRHGQFTLPAGTASGVCGFQQPVASARRINALRPVGPFGCVYRHLSVVG